MAFAIVIALMVAAWVLVSNGITTLDTVSIVAGMLIAIVALLMLLVTVGHKGEN